MDNKFNQDVEEFEKWKISRELTQNVEKTLIRKYSWIGGISAFILGSVLALLVKGSPIKGSVK